MANEIKILGKSIPLQSHEFSIDKLKFLRDNPRVYACTYGMPGFKDKPPEEQQEIIYEKLKQQSKFKDLVREIEEHGGLMEPVLVRSDTMEVVEGNSRLAAYRHLQEKQPNIKWETIRCNVVTRLTDDQQIAYLSQMHVKGKNPWPAYEKANFAYVMHSEKKRSYRAIAELCGEAIPTVKKRILAIQMMKDERDNNLSHFSYYYDALCSPNILNTMKGNPELREKIIKDIKNINNGDNKNNNFTVQELSKRLPVVIKKPKILKKFIRGEINLEDAYQRAKSDSLTKKIKEANVLLEDVNNKKSILELELKEFKEFKYSVRKLKTTVRRIDNILENYENK